MVAFGVFFVVIGVAIFGLADLIAKSARTLPSTVYADSPGTWRMVGLGCVIAGLVGAIVGAITGA